VRRYPNNLLEAKNNAIGEARMCLARIYEKKDSGNEIILENVASLEISEEDILISTILGETKELKGRIKTIDFANSSVFFEVNN
jgi:predicted RNA-binding protein